MLIDIREDAQLAPGAPRPSGLGPTRHLSDQPRYRLVMFGNHYLVPLAICFTSSGSRACTSLTDSHCITCLPLAPRMSLQPARGLTTIKGLLPVRSTRTSSSPVTKKTSEDLLVFKMSDITTSGVTFI